MRFLADVNVWLALTFNFRDDHSAAKNWFENHAVEGICFCRLTQQAFLRLATNVWSDAWLAAFAYTGGYEVVTFDRGFAQYRDLKCTILAS